MPMSIYPAALEKLKDIDMSMHRKMIRQREERERAAYMRWRTQKFKELALTLAMSALLVGVMLAA